MTIDAAANRCIKRRGKKATCHTYKVFQTRLRNALKRGEKLEVYMKDGRRVKPKKGRKGKRRATGAAARSRRGRRPRTPNMHVLNTYRRAWKRGDCREKRHNLNLLTRQLQKMKRLPGKTGLKVRKRNARYDSEVRKKIQLTRSYCAGRSISGLGAKHGGHPCASASPPAWCKK